MEVIDEARRHFEKENGCKPDVLSLTKIGIDALWHDIWGCDPYGMSNSEPLQDGDIVMWYTIRLDPDLPYGFRLSSSCQRKDQPERSDRLD